MDRFASMEAFIYVVETGSFSAAARQLGVGQPAVSKIIAQLEDRLGVQLLIRSTQGLTPTESGHGFYERAKRALEEAEEAEVAARGASAGFSGELRITAPVTFARLHLMPRLARFLADHPTLKIRVDLSDRNADLIESGADVALRMGTLEDSALVARKLAQCPRRVIGAPSYFERCTEPKVPADLAEHEFIIYGLRGGGEVWTFRRGGAESSVDLDGRLRVSAAEGVREAVFAGMGLAVASEWMFAPELESGMVRAVLQDWELPPMELWAVYPTGRRTSAKARAFVAFIQEVLSGAGAGESPNM
jgi:DNA-binding transcriptional LysR family regulator